MAVIAMAFVFVVMLVHDGEGGEEGEDDDDGGHMKRTIMRRMRVSMLSRRGDDKK